MLSILSKFIKFNRLCVIGVFNTDTGQRYYTLNLKKRKNSLYILSTGNYSSFKEMLIDIDAKVPVILNFDGKGIITKKVESGNEADVNWLKNIDFKTIYFSRLDTGDNAFISLCRKKIVDDTIEIFKSNKLKLLDFNIGPLLAAIIYETIGDDNIISNDSILKFENTHIKEVLKSQEEDIRFYKITDKSLTQYHLPLYGYAINFYINHKDVKSNTSDTINNEELIYKEAFRKFGLSMLVFFFISLLISFILLQYYGSKNVELNQKNVFSNQTYDLILQLKKQKEQKLKILNDTGQLSKKFLSYYVYELARSVPYNVNLSGINVFPVVKQIKANQKVILNSGHIIVIGSTVEENSFDGWLAELKEMSWIKKFEIISLKKDKKNVLQFEIKILVNNV